MHRTMQGWGSRVQYSVFVCDLDRREMIGMRTRVGALINHDADSVLIVDLGPAEECAARFEFIGTPIRLPKGGPQVVYILSSAPVARAPNGSTRSREPHLDNRIPDSPGPGPWAGSESEWSTVRPRGILCAHRSKVVLRTVERAVWPVLAGSHCR